MEKSKAKSRKKRRPLSLAPRKAKAAYRFARNIGYSPEEAEGFVRRALLAEFGKDLDEARISRLVRSAARNGK